jgi:YD repeat-containing protein
LGKRWLMLIFAALAATLIAVPSIAQEAVTYTYDALGRLIASSISGGPNNGTQTGTTFDPASNRTNYSVTGTPAPPSFAIGNAPAVTEGGILSYTVTKTGGSSASYSVNYATANGTAASGSDYTAASETLTFAAGETTKTIQVQTIDDSVIEPAETVLVNLSSPTNGATITIAQGSGTINDNDASFAIGNAATVTEGGTLSYTVTKTGGTSGSYSVNYAAANGTATSGSDFTATSGTLTFAAGETTKTIQVPTTDDNVIESAETVLVNLSSPSGNATITTAQGSGTIYDNDVSFAISNAAAVTEGGTLTFTVTRSGTTSSGFSVNYATASGTATSDSDFTATSGTLTFLASEVTGKTITVATIDDSVIESPETVLVNLSSPTDGARITTSQGSGTINDNDSGPVANADTTSFDCSAYQTVNLVANDTDPGNNVPLHLVSITGPGSATVTSTTSVRIGETSPGTYTFNYVVANSLGATSTGQLTATVTGLASQCVVF